MAWNRSRICCTRKLVDWTGPTSALRILQPPDDSQSRTRIKTCPACGRVQNGPLLVRWFFATRALNVPRCGLPLSWLSETGPWNREFITKYSVFCNSAQIHDSRAERDVQH